MAIDKYDGADWTPLHPENGVHQLRMANTRLEEENERLRCENGDLLRKWVAAQDQSTARMVMGLLGICVWCKQESSPGHECHVARTVDAKTAEGYVG